MTEFSHMNSIMPYPKQIWKEHGLACPTENPYHQPHRLPWWAGESVYTDFGTQYKQPTGPFFHVVFPQHGIVPFLNVGDYLTSPAERKTLPKRLEPFLESDGCISYANYDAHAVYVTTRKGHGDFLAYRVQPESLLWPDPERPVRDDWCTKRAKILEVIIPENGQKYWCEND